MLRGVGPAFVSMLSHDEDGYDRHYHHVAARNPLKGYREISWGISLDPGCTGLDAGNCAGIVVLCPVVHSQTEFAILAIAIYCGREELF